MPMGAQDVTAEHYLSHVSLMQDWLAVWAASWAAAAASPPCAPGHTVSRPPDVERLLADRLSRAAEDLAQARTLGLLAAGLAAAPASLGHRETTGALAPVAPSAPASRDDALWWGVAYVVEGSALGGQMLRRRWADRLQPLRMCLLSAEEPGPGWRRFLQQLDETLADDSDRIARASLGACQAFQTLLDRLR